MKKYLLILVAALTIVGCAKKPAQQEEQANQEQAAGQEASAVTEEAMYLDFTALTPNGDEMSLSDFVGKTDYVLVDFWASWCGPCRRFIPLLKDLYSCNKGENKLQIVSCSVDQDITAWKTALSEENMPWPQLHEDAAHPCSDKYNVQYIPHTVLIDKNGKIVGVNMEEVELYWLVFNIDIVTD